MRSAMINNESLFGSGCSAKRAGNYAELVDLFDGPLLAFRVVLFWHVINDQICQFWVDIKSQFNGPQQLQWGNWFVWCVWCYFEAKFLWICYFSIQHHHWRVSIEDDLWIINQKKIRAFRNKLIGNNGCGGWGEDCVPCPNPLSKT